MSLEKDRQLAYVSINDSSHATLTASTKGSKHVTHVFLFFLHLESLCHTGLDPGWTNQNKGAQVPTTPILVQKIPKSAPKRYALLLVDIFTKYVDVVPMVNNQAPSVVSALKQGITNFSG